MKNVKLICLSAIGAVLLFASCRKEDSNNASNPANAPVNGEAKMARPGYVYTESNVSGTNTILIYKQNPDGSLTANGTVSSGGMGTGANLGSQGALALNADHTWLFAVNAGDSSISSFSVGMDGSLTLANTVPSGGGNPISVTVHENLLYVLNAGSATISGFWIGAGGTLTAIAGSQQALSGAGTSPEQISFSPNGTHIYVTEKVSNNIDAYAVSDSGVASAGRFMPATGVNPYGFAFARHRFLVVSNAAGGNTGAATTTSYDGALTGQLRSANGAVADNGTSACWMTTTASGDYAYVCNAASNNISLYSIAVNNGRLTLLNGAAAPGNHPIDIIVNGNDSFVYNLNDGDQTLGEFSIAHEGSLTSLGTVSGLPASATGLIGY